MNFSFTGLSWLFAALVIGFLAYRFFQYQERGKSTVSVSWFYFTAVTFLFLFVTAIGGLFFTQNSDILRWTVIIATFLEIIASAILGYLIVFFWFPKVSPKIGFWLIFILALPALIATIILPFHPFFDSFGAINWDINPTAGFLRFLIFIITFLPAGVILIQQYRRAKDKRLKDRSIGLGTLIIFGFVTGFLDFVLETILGLETISSDIAMLFLSFVALIIILLTQKPLAKKEKHISSSYPQIQW